MAEVTIPLDDAPLAGANIGFDAVDPRKALRTGGRDCAGEIGIEFDFLAIRLGATQHMTVVVVGYKDGWWSKERTRRDAVRRLDWLRRLDASSRT